MTTDMLNDVATLLRQRRPTIEVRTDQCDIVRVHAGRKLVGVKTVEGVFEATVVLLEGDIDFETEVKSVLRARSAEQIVDKVLFVIDDP
jgi:hypothetical protein